MRRILAAAALGLAAFGLLVPVSQAHDSSSHTVEWGSPLGQDDKVWDTEPLQLRFESSDPVSQWEIRMVHLDSGATSSCHGGATDENSPTFDCNWDTTRVGDMNPGAAHPASAPNGTYEVTGTVWAKCIVLSLIGCSSDFDPHPAEPFTVIVANDVSAPRDVKLFFNKDTRKARVTWAPNPEPDVTNYVLESKFNGGAWTKVHETGGTSYEHPVDTGSYAYRVTAHRPAAQRDPAARTAATSGASSTLNVPAPPPPPTSATAGAPAPAQGETPRGGDTPPTASGSGDPVPATPGTSASSPSTARSGPNRSSARGKVKSRPPTRSTAPRATTPTTIDDGYEEVLDYPTTVPPTIPPDPDPEPETVASPRYITVPKPSDPRALLVPLAGGLAVFVLAMQATYVLRRRPALANSEDDFGDWVGF